MAARRISRGDSCVAIEGLRLPAHLLDQVEKRAAVAVGHVEKRVARRRGQGKRAAQFVLGAVGQPFQRRHVKPVKRDHLRARQKGGVQLEAGVSVVAPTNRMVPSSIRAKSRPAAPC